MRRSLLLLLLVGLTSSTSLAGRYNHELSVGDAAPAWKELTGTDGKTHSLADLADDQAVLVVFTANSCPYALDAEDRLIEISRKYSGRGLTVVAINANMSPADSMTAMVDRAQEKKYPFPYLRDETQQTAKAYGAKYTPECFLLDNERRVVYMGAIDDSPPGDDIKHPYLIDAIEAMLAGKAPQVAESAPVGCAIRYQRSRRRKSVD